MSHHVSVRLVIVVHETALGKIAHRVDRLTGQDTAAVARIVQQCLRGHAHDHVAGRVEFDELDEKESSIEREWSFVLDMVVGEAAASV